MKTPNLFTASLVALGAIALAAPAVDAGDLSQKDSSRTAQAGGGGSGGGGGTTAPGGSGMPGQNTDQSGTTGGSTGQGTMGQSGTGQSQMGAQRTTGGQQMTQVQAEKLIGADVKNAQNETIGEVEAVRLGQGGSVQDVIVSVGGFLGMGARDVALSWNDLQVTQNGEAVQTTMTEEQLRNLPEYEYNDASQRGKVFTGQ